MSHTIIEMSNAELLLISVVFLLVYVMIVLEKVNRAVIAIIGGLSMVFLGFLEIERAFARYIDWETIALLISMMIIVSITNQSGIFQYIALKTAKKMRGNPLRILHALCLLTAVSSAFLDNVTTVLLMVPVTLSITRALQIQPVPFFIAEILASNVGGAATLIGDPPNLMIAGANTHLTFNEFLFHLAPVIIVVYTLNSLMLSRFYARELTSDSVKVKQLLSIDEQTCIKDRLLAVKSVFVLGLTLTGFMLHAFIDFEIVAISMTGAALLLLWGAKHVDAEEVLGSLEWTTIFFFIGLFMLVGGLVEAGLIKQLAFQVMQWTGGNYAVLVLLLLWVSGIVSGTIDNIPYVATMIPLVKDIGYTLGLDMQSQEMNVLWWALSLGSCLGGNATLIGATANVIVAGLAAKNGHSFGYMEFLKIGAPLTLLSLLICSLYLMYRYLIFLSL